MVCKMPSRGKQIPDPVAYGADLRRRRRVLDLRLVDLAAKTSIDVGQLSRFECGDFKYESTNLQTYARLLQSLESTKPPPGDDDLSRYAQRLALRSPKLKAAALAILSALEELG